MRGIKNVGIYRALVAQLDKVARHNRQGSYRTRDRYYEANKRFCAFLADHYHLQKLANVSGKHLTAYVIHMQESGKSPSTIKTDSDLMKLGSMIKTYLTHGGKHVQFNVVDRGEMEDAKINPDDHSELIVRVAGYSAYFTRLPVSIQDEVINRSEQKL